MQDDQPNTAVFDCPHCCEELHIHIRAEISPGEYDDVPVIEAMLCDLKPAGRAFYHCECGYEELLDSEE